MVPYDYVTFINTLTKAVNNGDVPMERIDDAVRRILAVKFQLGLFERPLADESLLPLVGSDEHRELAREAVRKSLVLLRNDNHTLPLAKDTPLIFCRRTSGKGCRHPVWWLDHGVAGKGGQYHSGDHDIGRGQEHGS